MSWIFKLVTTQRGGDSIVHKESARELVVGAAMEAQDNNWKVKEMELRKLFFYSMWFFYNGLI